MKDQEAIQMMEHASAEIKSLRQMIDRLRPRAEAFDAVQGVLNLMPRHGEPMGEDAAWKLDRRIRELKAAAKEAGASLTPSKE